MDTTAEVSVDTTEVSVDTTEVSEEYTAEASMLVAVAGDGIRVRVFSVFFFFACFYLTFVPF